MSVGMEIIGARKVEALPTQKSLLPNEVATQIGCVGCKNGLGIFVFETSGHQGRLDLEGDFKAAVDLVEVPVIFRNGVSTKKFGPDMPTDTTCDRTACQNLAAQEMFGDIVAGSY